MVIIIDNAELFVHDTQLHLQYTMRTRPQKHQPESVDPNSVHFVVVSY